MNMSMASNTLSIYTYSECSIGIHSIFNSNPFITLTEWWAPKGIQLELIEVRLIFFIFFIVEFSNDDSLCLVDQIELRLSPRPQFVFVRMRIGLHRCVYHQHLYTLGGGNELEIINSNNNQQRFTKLFESICSGKWFSFHWNRISNVRGWTFKNIWTLLDKSGPAF